MEGSQTKCNAEKDEDARHSTTLKEGCRKRRKMERGGAREGRRRDNAAKRYTVPSMRLDTENAWHAAKSGDRVLLYKRQKCNMRKSHGGFDLAMQVQEAMDKVSSACA